MGPIPISFHPFRQCGYGLVTDTHKKLINHEAKSVAFVCSLLLTLAVGILRIFGFLARAALLVPVLMIALWSIGLILFSWRYQE